MTHRLYVGTIGEGLWRSLDGGASFSRAANVMFVECHVRALAVHPENPRTLFLGSEQGVLVSRDGAENWERLRAPLLSGRQIWSILISPHNPKIMVVGACPARLYRTADGGQTWAEASVKMVQDCPRIMFTRVTSLLVDPASGESWWAGVEIDGLYRSQDWENWHATGQGLSSRDIHALAWTGPGRLLAATNNDLNLSTDAGETWKPLHIEQSMPWAYCRTLAQPVGHPEIVFLGNGDAPPGSAGAIGRSGDGGATWTPVALPGRPNSTIWNFAVHPADPNRIYASSVSGEIYRSHDQGGSWEKLPREFGEIRALAWTP